MALGFIARLSQIEIQLREAYPQQNLQGLRDFHAVAEARQEHARPILCESRGQFRLPCGLVQSGGFMRFDAGKVADESDELAPMHVKSKSMPALTEKIQLAQGERDLILQYGYSFDRLAKSLRRHCGGGRKTS